MTRAEAPRVLGVVGAGTMGASLAQCYAQNGFVVGLLDVKEEILEAAYRTIEAEFAHAVKARIFTPIVWPIMAISFVRMASTAFASCRRAAISTRLRTAPYWTHWVCRVRVSR